MPIKGPTKLQPFLFHGVELTWGGDPQAQGDCPFCLKESHFYVRKQTGQWDCKSCGRKGNIYSFLTEIWEISRDASLGCKEDYQVLAEARGIPAGALKTWGLAKSIIGGDWLIPAFNAQGKLANLCRVEPKTFRLLSTPGCTLHPFGPVPGPTNKRQKTLWVCEGPWDGMALWSALATIKARGKPPRYIKTTNPAGSLGASQAVLAVPGAGIFKEDWLALLDGRDCRLVYDNDHPRATCKGCRKQYSKAEKACPHCGGKDRGPKVSRPGWDGMARVVKLVSESGTRPKTLHRLRWGKTGHDLNLADGYDVRDLIRDRGPVGALRLLSERLERVRSSDTRKGTKGREEEPPGLEPLPRETFRQLCGDYSEALHFGPLMRDTLATMLAVAVSTTLGGDQLWLRVIGPPGSGKTTLAEALSCAREYIFPVSSITGLHSGFTGGDRAVRRKDASLIPKMDGKTTIIKDGDTLLTAPNRDKILAEMRDLYDGTSRSHYRNRVARSYEGLRTTFILCATDEIRSLNRTFLGERFLDCEILGKDEASPYLDRALSNAYGHILDTWKPSEEQEAQDEETALYLHRVTYGYLQHLKEGLTSLPPPDLPQGIGTKIKALGQILSMMRARVNREKGEALAYRPRAELATRLVGQLAKLGVCLSIVLNKKTVDNETFRIIRKVALDTACGFHLEITQLLIRYKAGLSAKQIGMELGLSETSIRRNLLDMAEFQIVKRGSRPNRSGVRGRDLHIWSLSPSVGRLWREAGLATRKKEQ